MRNYSYETTRAREERVISINFRSIEEQDGLRQIRFLAFGGVGSPSRRRRLGGETWKKELKSERYLCLIDMPKFSIFKPDLQPSDIVSQIAEISLMDFKSRYSFPHAHLTGNSFCYHTGDPTPRSARFFLRFPKFLFADKSSLIPLFASARPKCVKISMIRALSGYSEDRPGKGDFLITLHS